MNGSAASQLRLWGARLRERHRLAGSFAVTCLAAVVALGLAPCRASADTSPGVDFLSSFIHSWSAARQTGSYDASIDLNSDGRLDRGDCQVAVEYFLGRGLTECLSVAAGGTTGNSWSQSVAISTDGRYVAFTSAASDLVPGDTNGCADIFVRDRLTHQTERVSVAGGGTQANDASANPCISADGRYVVFDSTATNLVPGDTNRASDAFVHDRLTGQTERVSIASNGAEGNGASIEPSISADGNCVAFASGATNLVPGDTKHQLDIFVHDRQTGQTERVSVASDGTQANSRTWTPGITPDGRYVVFYSVSTNLVPGDTNGLYDVFVHDRQTGLLERVSLASNGAQGNGGSIYPSMSADGRYVAFESAASNLVPGDTNLVHDILVHDRQTGQTERVSVASDGTQGNNDSVTPCMSPDGRYVAFQSYATNLVPGDTNGSVDVFAHDRATGQTIRVSVANDATQSDASSWHSAISAGGRWIAFDSSASNLVAGDTNQAMDVFLHDRWPWLGQ